MLSHPIVSGIVAYLAASQAASLTIAIGATPRESATQVLGAAVLFSLVVTAVAWVPAIGFMIYGARARMRSILYYVAVGLFCGLFFFCVAYAIGLFEESDGSIAPFSAVQLVQFTAAVFLFPGVSAGLTYWVIAGRNAGLPRS